MAGTEFYVDDGGEHRWRVRAGNFRNLGNSGEGYHNRLDAVKGLIALVENVDVDELRRIVAEHETRQAEGQPQEGEI